MSEVDVYFSYTFIFCSVYSAAHEVPAQVCLEWKPNSYDYRTQLPSFPKLQHCPTDCVPR